MQAKKVAAVLPESIDAPPKSRFVVTGVAKRVDGNAPLGNLLVTVGDHHVPTADFVVKFSWKKKNRKDLTQALKGWKQQIGQNDCMEKRKANHSERTMKTTWP